jgi:hypothetical protein
MSEAAIYFGIVPTTLLLIVGLAYTLLQFYRFETREVRLRHAAAQTNRNNAERNTREDTANDVVEVRQKARAALQAVQGASPSR